MGVFVFINSFSLRSNGSTNMKVLKSALMFDNLDFSLMQSCASMPQQVTDDHTALLKGLDFKH